MVFSTSISNTGNMTSGVLDEINSNPLYLGSLSFNGSSTYLQTPNSTAINFGTNNFTVEAWVYLNSAVTAGSFPGIISLRNSNTFRFAWSSYISGGNLWNFYFSTGGDSTTSGYGASHSTALVTGTWNHVSACRVGTTLYLSVNGVVQSFTVTASAVYNNTVDTTYIGKIDAAASSSIYFLNGFISNLRVINGTALYTSNFTPPTGLLSAVTNTSLLLNTPYTIDYLKDSSINNFTVTNNGSVSSNPADPITPDGNFSVSLNGTSQYLTVPSSTAFATGTGNFTVEAWVYHNGAAPGGGVTKDRLVFGGFTTSPAQVFFLTNDTLYPAMWDGTTQYTANSNPVSPNTWTHVAWVRASNVMKFYVNGQLSGPTTGSISTNFTATRTSYIGKNDSASDRYFFGYISNLRFVKGTAIYSSNFTPSTTPLKTITNTSLLTCQSPSFKDNSTNAFNITTSDSPTISTTVPFSGIDYTGSGISVQKQYSNGTIQVAGVFDEVTINPISSGLAQRLLSTGNLQLAGIYNEAVANGLPVIDSSLIMWLDPSVLLGAQSYVQGDTVMKSLTDANTVNTSYPTVSLNGSLPYTLLPTTHQGYFTSSGGGSGGYISIASSSASYTCPPLMTACVWAYTANWQSPGDLRIMSCTDAGGWSISFSDPGIPSGNMGGQIYAGGYRYVYLPTSAVSAGWHHWAMSWDGRYLKLYLDGVSASSLGYSTGTYDIGSSGNSIGLGTYLLIFVEPQQTNPIDNRFPGSVGQCLLYNRALSNTEIQTIYNSRAGLYF